jgi:hypothetical protein
MGNTRVIAAVYGPREVLPLLRLAWFGAGLIGHAHSLFEQLPLRGDLLPLYGV